MLLKSRNLAALSLIAACVGCTTGPARGDVLIYSDHSPGALPFYVVQNAMAEDRQESVTLVTSTSAFENELSNGPWSNVVVAARHASSEPSYATSLRDYAELGNDVEMYFWHRNGTTPTVDTAVTAVTGMVTWRDGTWSTVVYTGGPQAASSTGLSFPSFSGITLADPVVIATASDTQGLSDPAIIALVIALLDGSAGDACAECLQVCLNTWNERNDYCNDQHGLQTDHCESEFENDPPGLVDCLNTADKHRQNCRNSAVFSYNQRVSGCSGFCGPVE